jgi:hypothetical protein
MPERIWDVNGYYRELGVATDATRKQLRLAYQAKDGQSSERLTYIITQLLNPEVRFAYDCAPPGEPFLDKYVWEQIRARMKDRISDAMQRMHDLGVDLDLVNDEALERDVAAEMGFRPVEEDTPSEVVDSDPSSGQDDPDRPAKFEYSYYLWNTRSRQDDRLGRLAEWQQMLVSAFSREGLRITFAVGIHGGHPSTWIEAEVGYRKVLFLREGLEPTIELAEVVAKTIAGEDQ